MIGEKTAEVEAFWQKCRAEQGIETDDYHAKTFANPEFSQKGDEVARLVLDANKRATAHLAMDFEKLGVARRQPGDYWVLLDYANKPMCLLRVTKVEVIPFDEVGEDLALAEDEGDKSLAFWERVHRTYFQKLCAGWGVEWRDDLPVVAEYFYLVQTA